MPDSMTTDNKEFLKYSYTVGLSVMEGRGFSYPSDTAIRRDNRLYVVNRGIDSEDYRQVRGTICSLESDYFGDFGSFGDAEGKFISPTSVAIDSNGLVYVSDEFTHLISIFDENGVFLSRWGVHGSADGELDGPSGLAFDQEDRLYVVDHLNNRIQKFTTDGRFLFSFGSEGSCDGQFNLPWGITIDVQGAIYVADWRNDRIQKFASDGTFLCRYGSPGINDGQFSRPSSVAVDQSGYLYVADWGNERVQVLDPSGRFVTKLRGEATLSDWAKEFFESNTEEADARAKANLEPVMEFYGDPHEESSHVEKFFWAPVSVKLTADGRLCVTESNRHRIQVYTHA